MSGLDLRALREAASLLPDEIIEHEGDCAGSLCESCGHCLHSIETCGCTTCGCHEALDTSEVLIRRQMLALLDRVEAAEGALEEVRALAKFWTDADGEPATDRDLTVLNVTNRHGRELTAALDGPR